MVKITFTQIFTSIFFLLSVTLNYFIYVQLSKHLQETKVGQATCNAQLFASLKETQQFNNKTKALEFQLNEQVARIHMLTNEKNNLLKLNQELNSVLRKEREDGITQKATIKKQLDMWQYPRISPETPYLSTTLIEPRPINKYPEYKEELFNSGKLASSKAVQDYPTLIHFNTLDTVKRLGYKDEMGNVINNTTALALKIKELKYSERLAEFEIMYRYTWKENGQVQLSDHVYLEPMWKVSVKCPKENDKELLEVSEWTSYSLPEKSFSDYDPKVHGSPNKDKRTRKTLGVYIALTEIKKDGTLYKENSGHRISLFDTIDNWKNMFIKKYNYPIVIFHFGKMTERIRNIFMEKVGDIKDCKMYFVEINPDEFLPSRFTKQPWAAQEKEHNRFNKRYFDMSKFLAHDLYKHPIMDNFVYYLRLDDDATFYYPMNYDPFKFMYLNNLLVGYSMLGMPESGDKNRPWTTQFIERTWTYCLKQGILPPEEVRINGNFGTADTLHAGPFELGKISVYNNPAYDHYLESVNIWEGMATWGWREQFVKTIWVKLYIPRLSTHWFCDFAMHHYVPFAQRCYIDCV